VILGSLYFEHPTALSIIIILIKGSSSRKEIAPIVIQAIVMQERNTMVKALDFYYKDRNKLDSFLILIDIYILFN
jgi:fibrillarin-like rRNA methylase